MGKVDITAPPLSHVQVDSPTGFGDDTKLVIDGDTPNDVKSLEMRISAQETNRLVIEHDCILLDVDGQFTIEHQCGLDDSALEKAIAIIEDSRETHVEWLKWQEENPDWRDHMEPDSAGDPEHHRNCIAEYDIVLKFLGAA